MGTAAIKGLEHQKHGIYRYMWTHGGFTWFYRACFVWQHVRHCLPNHDAVNIAPGYWTYLNKQNYCSTTRGFRFVLFYIPGKQVSSGPRFCFALVSRRQQKPSVDILVILSIIKHYPESFLISVLLIWKTNQLKHGTIVEKNKKHNVPYLVFAILVKHTKVLQVDDGGKKGLKLESLQASVQYL